ncbi:glycosyltransferase family 39 protein [Candidatus Dojkabacteria bacterium]|uniref:Glycosyltransferase family 39 protein n=1 Tax=Candidatus Dojkabacteria bacterium TaxID=2099670 RepID=A0A955RIY5_9BACT|nr:glycosyltransferase family 39 protein [Candidatus Dojkabacteria bacterium]
MKNFFSKHKNILLLSIVAFILLRLPSFWEPNWHPDEGFYATVATSMANGKILYRDTFDHKAPLIYFTYMLGSGLGKLFYIKLLNLIFGLVGLIGFSRLVKVFSKSTAVYLASIISFTLLFGSSFREGNIANTENFFVPIVIWALVLALEYPTKIKYFISGILFAFAFQYKFHSLLDLFALCLFWLVLDPKNVVQLIKDKLVWILGGFGLVNFLVVIFLLLKGLFFDYFNAVYLFSFSYSTDNRGFVLNRLDVKLLVYLLLLIWAYWKYKKKQNISEKTFLLLILASSALFAMSLGGRNYPHYYLQLVPYASIIIGFLYVKYLQHNKLLLTGAVITIFSGLLLLHLVGGYKNAACQRQGILSPNESVFRYYYVFGKYLTGDTYTHSEYFNCIEMHIEDLQEQVADLDPEQIYIYDFIGWHYLAIGYEPPVVFLNPYHTFLSDYIAEDVIKELKANNVDMIAIRVGIDPEDGLEDLIQEDYELVSSSRYYNFYRINE